MKDNTKAVILIVEDEPEVLAINARMLKRRGYDVITACSAGEAYDCLNKTTPDMLILDIMLPDGSGYDVCTYFRDKSDNPVMFLTGKSEVADKVEGLERGGDYYLTKPYSFEELAAVVERLLNRHIKAKEKYKKTDYIKKGSVMLEMSKNKAYINGRDANLTIKEFALLLLMAKNENRIFSPQELYETVWGAPSADDTRTIRFHMRNLKKKIDTENADDYDIVSVYGKGYFFTTA